MVLASFAALLLGGLVMTLAASRGGGDFGAIHLTGVAVLRGLPVYNRAFQLELFAHGEYPGTPQGMFYPPATGVAALPFAFLSFHAAQRVFYALTFLAIVFGVRALVRSIRPELQPQAWRFMAALVLLSAGVRWGATPGQGAPLMLGLLCLFVAQLFNGRHWLAIAIAAYAMAFKLTLALPFVILLLAWRKYVGVVVAGATWLLSNGFGLLRVGGLAAMRDYQTNITVLEALGDINTPDPWDPISVPRTDFTYLMFGILRNLPLARALTKVFCILVMMGVVWLAWRLGPKPTKRQVVGYLLIGTCLGSLAVYHHHYDWAVLIAPLLLAGLLFESVPLKRMDWMLLSPIFLMLGLLPIALTQRLLVQGLGREGASLLNFSFPLLSLVGTGVGLRSLAAEVRAAQLG